MTAFRPIFDPATGERIEYTAIAQDTSGELVRFSSAPPSGASATRAG